MEIRNTWHVGPLQFATSRQNGGWLLWGWVGDYEFLPECYLEGDIDGVMSYAREWTKSFLIDLLQENEEI